MIELTGSSKTGRVPRFLSTWRTCLAVGLLATGLQAGASETLKKVQVPRGAAAYKTEFVRIQHATSPQSMEKLFKMGEQVRTALLSPRNLELLNTAHSEAFAGRRSHAETDRWTKSLMQQLPGYNIAQGAELFYDHPDAAVFLDLATRHGQAIDREFFTRYQASFPENESWPAHEEQQTDISSCSRYGSEELIGHYTRWQGFLESHPQGFYAEKAKAYLGEEHFDLTRRCSCDSKVSTLKGLLRLRGLLPPGEARDKLGEEIQKRTRDGQKEYEYDGLCQAG